MSHLRVMGTPYEQGLIPFRAIGGIEKLTHPHDPPTGLMPKAKTPMRLSIKFFKPVSWISRKETS
ncbi:MAG: hypothetical protein A2Y80_00860 [Deltaproteobacteria bacterium RBG_13_58_19]|nr:MAG: hypothetical protein A2Y80_00860 [Deltaproteobacteria bacterium RBG_13_58_19]